MNKANEEAAFLKAFHFSEHGNEDEKAKAKLLYTALRARPSALEQEALDHLLAAIEAGRLNIVFNRDPDTFAAVKMSDFSGAPYLEFSDKPPLINLRAATGETEAVTAANLLSLYNTIVLGEPSELATKMRRASAYWGPITPLPPPKTAPLRKLEVPAPAA